MRHHTPLFALLILFLAIPPAFADFRLCNNTASRVGVAIGYRDKDGWATEGWWNVKSRECQTLLKGPLAARFYYVYAIDYDQGGEWGGKSFLCTREKEFTIRGFENCLARGFERTGFFEIDSGEQKSWTVQLSEQAQTGPAPSGFTPSSSTNGRSNPSTPSTLPQKNAPPQPLDAPLPPPTGSPPPRAPSAPAAP